MNDIYHKTSDTELMVKASDLLNVESYRKDREKYQIRNPKKYVSADTHRRIMQEAIDIAKTVIDRSGTTEEVTEACEYLYICMDARKYRLDWRKARGDLHIEEMIRKYKTEASAD